MSLHENGQQALFLASVQGTLDNHVYRIFEARCNDAIESKLPNFVVGAVNSTVGAGLVMKDLPLYSDRTERTIRVIENTEDSDCLLWIDYKTIAPHLGDVFSSGLYHYRIKISHKQRHCIALVLQNPAAPDRVAVVPMHYLVRKSAGPGGVIVYGREMPLSACPVEPWPMEISPFEMPFKYLFQTMTSLSKFGAGEEKTWRNAYSDLVFEDHPEAIHRSINGLLPNKKSDLDEFRDIKTIWNAFDQHSDRWMVQMIPLKRCLGDFLLVHKKDKSKVIVELERRPAELQKNGTIRQPWCRGEDYGKLVEYPFTSMAGWTYLLSVFTQPDGKAFFAHRDQLPLSWFEGHEPQSELTWKPGEAELEDMMVDYTLDRQFVERITSILDKRLEKFGTFESVHERPYGLIFQEREVVERENRATRQNNKPKGGKSRGIRKVAAVASEILDAEEEVYSLQAACKARGFGMIYFLGRHPSASHVFVPGPCVEPQPSFFELPLETPMIFLNFARLSITDVIEPHDKFRTASYIPVTHGLSPSFFILSPLLREHASHNLYRFLIPSQALDTPERRAFHENFLSKTIGWDAKPGALATRGGEPLDCYAKSYLQIVDWLQSSVSSAETESWIGEGKFGTHVDMEKHVVDNRTVRAQFMELYRGEGYQQVTSGSAKQGEKKSSTPQKKKGKNVAKD